MRNEDVDKCFSLSIRTESKRWRAKHQLAKYAHAHMARNRSRHGGTSAAGRDTKDGMLTRATGNDERHNSAGGWSTKVMDCATLPSDFARGVKSSSQVKRTLRIKLCHGR